MGCFKYPVGHQCLSPKGELSIHLGESSQAPIGAEIGQTRLWADLAEGFGRSDEGSLGQPTVFIGISNGSHRQ
jgi:hypothetical protein